MLLSGGTPLIYASAALYFSSTYWFEKWELLKLSRRPVAYSGDLAAMVTNVLPYAAVGGGMAPWLAHGPPHGCACVHGLIRLPYL